MVFKRRNFAKCYTENPTGPPCGVQRRKAVFLRCVETEIGSSPPQFLPPNGASRCSRLGLATRLPRCSLGHKVSHGRD